jgi:hypothetical protein
LTLCIFDFIIIFMSDVRSELAFSATGLEVVSTAAMTSLGLTPGEFAWFSGESRQPMQPQTILPESDLKHDYYTSNISFYGGLIANELGNFTCGHIRADIPEHIPGSAKHQSGRHESPAPYVPRLLNSNHGIISVDTPTLNPSLSDGPVVIEGMRRDPRFRIETLYHTETSAVAFKSGELITDGLGWKDDRTVEHDAFEFPDDILLPRLATLLRTIKATSAMFEKIVWGDDSVSVRIQEELPER